MVFVIHEFELSKNYEQIFLLTQLIRVLCTIEIHPKRTNTMFMFIENFFNGDQLLIMNLFTESDHVYLMTLCNEQPIIPKLFKGPPTHPTHKMKMILYQMH